MSEHTPGRCEKCHKKFPPELCPLQTYNCSCKGDYCRLLGRDPTEDTMCPTCRAKATTKPDRGAE